MGGVSTPTAMTKPEISVDHPEGAWTIRVRGTVADTDVSEFEEMLDQAIAWGTGDVILDVSDGVNLGQAAIDAVVEARQVLEKHGRRLVVVRKPT